MKIVYITFLYEPELGGGAAQVVYSLSRGLASQGHDITVITSAKTKNPLIECKNNVKIVRFFPRNLYWVNDKDHQPVYRKIIWQLIDLWNPFVYRAMRGFLESEKPDLVHVHKLRGLSPSVWSAVRATKVPVLAHTCHDYELVSPEGLLNGRIGKWSEKRALVMRPYQLIRSGCSSNVQLVTGPSQYVLNLHQRMGFFSNAKSKVIPNSHGFLSSQLQSLRENRIKDPVLPIRLLYLGRLAPEKGIGLLCEAITHLKDDLPKVILDIAGWGYFEKDLLDRYSGYENIRFHGAVFGEDKYRLINLCDLLVLPSTVPESFGIVIPEAYCFGKPVLASNIGGIPELVKDGETGFLFPPGDVQMLSTTIGAILANSNKLKSMKEACFESAKFFTEDLIMRRYMEFYDDPVLTKSN
jgi:glycosyltransferase involved in cell wall biosynthesis